jgi:hypothetical protein
MSTTENTPRLWVAENEHHLINLLSVAEGTHWTGIIDGPAERGWKTVYVFEDGTCTDRFMSKSGVQL